MELFKAPIFTYRFLQFPWRRAAPAPSGRHLTTCHAGLRLSTMEPVDEWNSKHAPVVL